MFDEDKPTPPRGGSKKVNERAESSAVDSESSPAAPEAAPAVKRTPARWAELLGHAHAARPHIPQSSARVSPKHAAADALYCWSQHAYHYQTEPFEITQEDYRKALDAAGQFPGVAPHAPALPPSQAKRFENFKPRASRKGHS